jgi:hypothetical protein
MVYRWQVPDWIRFTRSDLNAGAFFDHIMFSYHSVKRTGKPLIINPVHTGPQAFHDGDGIGQV